MFGRPIVLAVAFVLHRIFDITKPPPARQLEHLPTGLGIMADDWAAAAYALSSTSCRCTGPAYSDRFGPSSLLRTGSNWTNQP